MVKVVYLTGFMTCGKSTVGPILANTLGWNFYDLDQVIEEKERMTIVNIFESKGEDYFRNFETQTLKELSEEDNLVISLGGGTMSKQENVDIVKANGLSIYLKVSPEMIYKRLKHKIDRPLFKDLVLSERPKEEFVERINELLEHRKQYYEQADIIFESDDCLLGITVDKLAREIERINKFNRRKINEKN